MGSNNLDPNGFVITLPDPNSNEKRNSENNLNNDPDSPNKTIFDENYKRPEWLRMLRENPAESIDLEYIYKNYNQEEGKKNAKKQKIRKVI